MKALAIFFCCFIVAFFLGRWTPHYDLQLAKLQIRELEEKLEQGGKGANTQVTGMLGIRQAKDRHRRAAPPESTETNIPPDEVDADTRPAMTNERRGKPVSREQRLEEAIELWKVRTELAKTTFMDRLGAGPEEIMNFNVLMESLNLRAEATISNWVARVEHQERISPEDGIRLVSEILDSVVLTYDEMDRKLPANWREGVGDRFQLVEMIDPQVAAPLLRLEDRLGEVRF